MDERNHGDGYLRNASRRRHDDNNLPDNLLIGEGRAPGKHQWKARLLAGEKSKRYKTDKGSH